MSRFSQKRNRPNKGQSKKTQRPQLRRISRIESLETRTLLTINGIAVDVAPVADTAAVATTSSYGGNQERVLRIVNGSQTSGFESVGIVNEQCTGTLIAANAVLTAAHCIPEDVRETQSFNLGGRTYETERVAVHPGYFSEQDIDLAAMILKEDVVGIEPAAINRSTPQVGQVLTLVGFGATGTAQGGHNDDFGVKHVGQTPIDELTPTQVNWNFDNATEANTAPGDSGGPAFLELDGALALAGVTSGGTIESAALGDFSFDTRVDTFAGWVDDVIQGNISGTTTDTVPADSGDDLDSLAGEAGDDEFFDLGEFGEFDEEIDDATIEEWAIDELDQYDSDRNLMLSKEELVAEFLDYEFTPSEAREEATYLLDEFDADRNQQLDLSELVATYGGSTHFDESGQIDGESTILSDIDLDGLVGFPDFLILSSHYGDVPAELWQGDIDGDGAVGFVDFLTMSEDFGLESGGADSASEEDADLGRVLRIVNGTQTTDYEAVGLVNGQCTGTLIATNAVLTAAHCVEAGSSPQSFEVEGQTYTTNSVVVHPNYQSGDIDLAVMVLNSDVLGVDPVDISRVTPQVGQTLTLVGFGGTGTAQGGHNGDFGVKHVGQTPIDEVTPTAINWSFDDPTEANTAPGDSGGPAFLSVGSSLVVAGVTSGGTQENAGLGDNSFDTRVDVFASWVDGIVQANGGAVSPTPTSPTPPIDESDELDSDDDSVVFGQYASDELDAFDTNGDGMMSRRELINEFMDFGDSRREARDLADDLLNEFDVDGDNRLNLDELAATYGGELPEAELTAEQDSFDDGWGSWDWQYGELDGVFAGSDVWLWW